MSANHRFMSLGVVATTLAMGIVAGATPAGAVQAGAASGLADVSSVTVARPSVDRGIVIEVPRNAPGSVELERVFPPGTIFSVALYENATTGYLWNSSLATGPEQAVTYLDTDFVRDPAPPNMVGVGGTRYFRFQAQHSGQAVTTMVYQRSWEPQPIQQVILAVQVR